MYGGDEVGAMVLDFGTANTRVGFAGEDTPKAFFPTACGMMYTDAKGKRMAVGDEADQDDTKMDTGSGPASEYFVGKQASYRRDGMELVYPVKDGLVEDWAAVERIWDYSLKTLLRVNPKEHPMMIADPAFNTKDRREKMAELAFETFETPAIFMCKNPVLAAFSMGKSTAMVLDSGAGVTTAVPVHDGYVLNMGKQQSRMAGDMMDRYTEQALFSEEEGVVPQYCVKRSKQASGEFKVTRLKFPGTTASWHRYKQLQVVRDIKESLVAVSNTSLELKANQNIPSKGYELPDGRKLEVGGQRFALGEHLFAAAPDHAALEGDLPGKCEWAGLQKMVVDSIAACDVDIRKEMYGNIVLTGGTTLALGTAQRLKAELEQVVPPAYKAKVLTPATKAEQRLGVWIGGSILASLGSFHQMWFSRAEYQEHGAAHLAKKCP